MNKIIIVGLLLFTGCSKQKEIETYSDSVYNYTVTTEPEVEVIEEKSFTEINNRAYHNRYHKEACPYTGRCNYQYKTPDLPKWQAGRTICQNDRLANLVPQKSFLDQIFSI